MKENEASFIKKNIREYFYFSKWNLQNLIIITGKPSIFEYSSLNQVFLKSYNFHKHIHANCLRSIMTRTCCILIPNHSKNEFWELAPNSLLTCDFHYPHSLVHSWAWTARFTNWSPNACTLGDQNLTQYIGGKAFLVRWPSESFKKSPCNHPICSYPSKIPKQTSSLWCQNIPYLVFPFVFPTNSLLLQQQTIARSLYYLLSNYMKLSKDYRYF